MLNKSALLLAAAAVLSACGGSTALPPAAILPGASAGFAKASNSVSAQNVGVTFSNGPELIAFSPNAINSVQTPVSIANAVAGDGKIEVTVNGTTFDATETRDNTGTLIGYDGVNGTETFKLVLMASEQYAVLNGISVADSATNSALVGYSAMGFATDPAVIAAKGNVPAPLPTTASYTGNSFINIFSGPGTPQTYAGDIQAHADFANSSIIGSMDFKTLLGQQVVGIQFLDGQINGHMFNGSLIVLPSDVGMVGAPSSTDITGSFFGPNAENIAGQFNMTGSSGSGVQDVLVQGGFVGK